MGRYFDFREWDLEEICYSLRKRIAESKKPIPPKVKRHLISIIYRTDVNCYTYSNLKSLYSISDFKNRQEAIDFLNKFSWLTRTGDNSWEESSVRETYIDANGNEVKYHYEINEGDYEEYEDGESYFEYSNEEKEKLSEALHMIEKARVYINVYDHCCDQYSFGEGRFSDELKTELENFEKEYTENLSIEED